MAQATIQRVSGIEVEVEYAGKADRPVSEKEIRAYIARSHERYPTETLTSLRLEVDGEDVGISYGFKPVAFDRIRRITGYLVGTMDRWNDAKTAEEADRVKHGVSRANDALACTKGC